MTIMSSVLALALLLLKLPSLAEAYSWEFKSPPQQCANFSIQISGGGGTPPYRVLILPSGPSPLANNIEVRKIVDMPFDNDNSVSFKLNYPANSQLVAVVSDATGFGSGGTSVAAQVTSSSDTSCFDASKSVSPLWTFSINPINGLQQCNATRIYWNNPQAVQGTPSFFGVIPGGESFKVPVGNIDNESNAGFGTGFSWTPPIRGGTTLILVGGDNRGNGTGGSLFTTVGSNINNDNTCLNNNSPSSTPGNPAGGSYPTSSTGAGTGGGSGGGGTNVGAIVGGVIGGVVLIAAILLVLLFFRRRQKLHKRRSEKPDLLVADDDDIPPARASRNELPQFYEPEPFVVPEPSESGTGTDFEGRERRQSYVSHSGTDVLSTSGPSSTTTRKGGYQPRQMRPVNIIQHDDAGPSVGYKDEEPETIELPPAYTNIRPTGSPAPTTEASETTPPPAQAAA